MKFVLIAIVLILASCITGGKYRKNIIEKGYGEFGDTVIIKPYEYFIQNKGYTPIFGNVQ